MTLVLKALKGLSEQMCAVHAFYKYCMSDLPRTARVQKGVRHLKPNLQVADL